MRCRFRRLNYILFLSISLFLFYRIYNINPISLYSQSPFTLIHYQNNTYRILSSSFKHNSRGSYLNFAYFNVEQRNRVLYIDFLYDIPVSSQWQSDGHLYPIQIAQYGLSHWSRLELNSKNQQNKIYKFERLQPNKNNHCSSWHTIKDEIFLSNTYIHFTISSNCSLHFHFFSNNIELVYSTKTIHDLETLTKRIIPLKGSPRQASRYMLIDIEKLMRKTLVFRRDLIKIQICGDTQSSVTQLIIGNQTLYDQQAFYSATRWLLNNQDLQTGCWFIHVRRNYGHHTQYHLRNPWCSAMAQGQAASLLVRLYSLTNNKEHLLAIRRAIQPLWSSNLTRAYFNNRFLWLEEYPLESSTKGLFVLNGCLYALIGIIDANTIDYQPYLSELINQIIISLQHMLPYYVHPNISNWSLYDLSHITMKSKINTASYSYHLVHITLLQCLRQIFKKTNHSVSQLFDFYVQRFTSAIL
ncbi:unnamed protein product [Adineta steineri]|uniref:D-glucuronyl C5-epimerase C-terminal domain-containing protein n=1 Tax=Adineta steineri TaxID=433720 RepID=A0A813RQ58_9BILA|nr:unnamed protein product [Adineta steineri]CAF0788121.1 unnamed protein product [Adineta steineri]CAF0942000.1 unnamed protein product [Adineta steineri]